ncbi:hypothetical protein [Rudanella lutea]|uniref:hypothetical protein n=1 Tax=Rudanella lutea TaxID=451374 RepID=UPI000377F4E1|nr:hypothetical protein [Rudanella lutea]
MKFSLLLFFSLLNTVVWAQEKTALPPSDSTFFLATTLQTATLYTKTSLASDELKLLDEGRKLAVISYKKDVLEYLYVLDDTTAGYVPLSDVFILEDRLDYLKKRGDSGEAIRKNIAAITANFIAEERVKAARAILKKLEKYQRQGLLVSEWGFTEPGDIVGNVNVSFKILNPVKKKLKYIWFTVVAYNAVGDRTGDRLRGTQPATLKGVGPLEEWQEASWEFENVWYNETIDCVRITQIKVQYMDGSFRLFDKPNLIIAEGQGNSCKY